MKLTKQKISKNLIITASNGDLTGFVNAFYGLNNNANQFDIILEKAIENKHLNIVQYVIEHFNDVKLNNRMLIKSSIYGSFDIFKYLVEKGAKINTEKNSPIRFSAKNGHLDIVKFLVEKKVNIHAENEFALSMAACANHLEVVKYLVEKGAKIEHNNYEIFKICSREEKYLPMIEYLLESVKNKKEVSKIILENACAKCYEWTKKYMNLMELKEKLNNDLNREEHHDNSSKNKLKL